MKKICVIGGGHGTSRLIKGFKNVEAKIDVIVASNDNGGHTGEIIKEFEVPALGDLRMVLESLLDEPILKYFSYRFKRLHNIERVSLGNLMLLSMVLENNGCVDKMLEEINKQINDKFTIHLASNKYSELKALTYNDEIINGEENIGATSNIKDVFFQQEGLINTKVIEAIMNADIIVFSFGSFYTSLGSVIAHKKIQEALMATDAKIYYVANLVNQKETEGYCLENYVDFLENKLNRKLDEVILSSTKIKRKVLRAYQKEGKSIVVNKEKRDNYKWYPLVVDYDNKLRHDYLKVGQIISGQ